MKTSRLTPVSRKGLSATEHRQAQRSVCRNVLTYKTPRGARNRKRQTRFLTRLVTCAEPGAPRYESLMHFNCTVD